MAQINNLNKENLEKVDDFANKMQQHSPEVEYKTYPMDQKPVSNEELAEKVDALRAKIDFIFGNSVLINGRFTDIK